MVGQVGDTAYIKVQGRGSFKNAPSVKGYALHIQDQGVVNLVIDLMDCSHMDSTFMGVMAGLSMERRRQNLPKLSVRNINLRNSELLEQLGLDRLMDMESVPQGTPLPQGLDRLKSTPLEKQEMTRTMLDAHQNLVEVDAENGTKFEDVITFLRRKLGDKA
jgi:anti-anti-sigma regulatory factor